MEAGAAPCQLGHCRGLTGQNNQITAIEPGQGLPRPKMGATQRHFPCGLLPTTASVRRLQWSLKAQSGPPRLPPVALFASIALQPKPRAWRALPTLAVFHATPCLPRGRPSVPGANDPRGLCRTSEWRGLSTRMLGRREPWTKPRQLFPTPPPGAGASMGS